VLKKYDLIIAMLIFILVRNIAIPSWDLAVYKMNGFWWAGKSVYFEWTRAPLAPFMFFVLSIFGSLAVPIFVALSLILFVSAVRLFLSKYAKSSFIYLVLLSPAFVLYGLHNGTEVLSLSLLLLALYFYPKPHFGFFFALSVLARYNMLLYAPLFLLLGKIDLRKIILGVIIFAVTISPWIAYNYIKTSDPFYSMRDLYVIGVQDRQSIVQPVNLVHIILYFSILIASLFADLKVPENWKLWLVFILIPLYIYITTPIKAARYMFPLIIPISVISAQFIERRIPMAKLRKAALVLYVFGSLALLPYVALSLNEHATFKRSLDRVDDCMVASNVWVWIDNEGIPAAPADCSQVGSYLEKGYNVLMVGCDGPGYKMYLSDKCKEPEPYVLSYIQQYYPNYSWVWWYPGIIQG